ncbi:spore cortex biosynthesis protein YabQ [Fonticella tunisiensis]|uniref:Spore cortex biosynthesis protein YabQ n=1 Tax=Fonticella tunisiensis TaxID=1096341 RepID=A0A4R7KWV2_9CLOT|nr:spore cortex biosynthesis protein YabQ [Fonticella tunisiensis]TDT63470.1 spore cortex biosynthesis protein YabQ [Fonticella tunisiensis]
MILPIDVQIYYFLSTIIAGSGIGVMYDVYRILRGFKSPRKFITAVSDILFWTFAAIITFIFFLYTNHGDLGYYTFLGLSIGLLIYFRIVSKWFIKILRWILYYILKTIRIFSILILYPFKMLKYGANFIVYKIRELMGTGIKATKTKFKKIIKTKK